MTPFNQKKNQVDLRAPISTRLRKDTYTIWLRNITLFICDFSSLYLAWFIAINYSSNALNLFNLLSRQPILLFLFIFFEIILIAAQGLYQSGEKRCDYLKLIETITLAHVLLLIIAFLNYHSHTFSRTSYIFSWLLSLLLVCAARAGIDLLIRQLRQQGAIRSHTFLICKPEDTEKAYSLLEKQNRYKSIRVIDASTFSIGKSNIEALIEASRFLGVSEIFVCSWSHLQNRMFLYWSLRNTGINLRILLLELETFYRNLDISMLGGVPTIKFCPPLITGFDFWIKRGFDFIVSASLIALLSPILLGIAIIIKLDSPGPFFYKQERVGLHGRRFKVLKFRTMLINADHLQKELEERNEMKDGVLFKMKDDPRITRVGKILRRSSLDELPQLFNILFGEMSLVGPRPLPLRDVQKFSEHHFIRHEVLPGITGLWQVSGRSDITSFEQVVSLDTFYMENWSLALDLQILLRTAIVLLQKKGAY
jgi:exopolysaccharide biosynthesis polyprenyl glycosylphosphotransferase